MPYFTDLGGPMPKLVRDFIGESIKESQHSEKENSSVMNDYISREAAIKALSHGEGCGHVCRHSIERIPAADVVEVRHGRWLPVDDNMDAFDCSECDAMVSRRMNFCPNCGAKMDEEKGDNQ